MALLFLLFLMFSFSVIWYKSQHPHHGFKLDALWIAVTGVFQVASLFLGLNYISDMRQTVVKTLIDDDPSHVIGPLSYCLSDKDPDVRKSLSPALKAHLPRVQATDRAQFTPEVMDALVKALDGKDRDLTLAILKALEQIGDGRALEAVERLASKSKDARVRQAAEECLPALRESAEIARQSAILLRPAEAPADATLLRPAGKGEAEEALLLRPADQG